jgi:hypothetical protein
MTSASSGSTEAKRKMTDDEWRNYALATPRFWLHHLLGFTDHFLTRQRFSYLRQIGCVTSYQPIFGNAEQRQAIEELIRKAETGHALQRRYTGADALKAMFLAVVDPSRFDAAIYDQCQRAIIDRAAKMLASDGTPHPERVVLTLSRTGKQAYVVTLARDLLAQYLAREAMLTINVDRLVLKWMKHCQQLDTILCGAAAQAEITEWASDADLKWLQETKEKVT